MRSGGCGTDFFPSFNIGGVLGNYAMKFEIQSGGGLNFCVALPFIYFTFRKISACGVIQRWLNLRKFFTLTQTSKKKVPNHFPEQCQIVK